MPSRSRPPAATRAPHRLTASSTARARSIKLWLGERCVRTFSGHTDVVRALALVDGIGFLSASNDGTARLWELGGTCLATQHCGESFVYGIAVRSHGIK